MSQEHGGGGGLTFHFVHIQFRNYSVDDAFRYHAIIFYLHLSRSKTVVSLILTFGFVLKDLRCFRLNYGGLSRRAVFFFFFLYFRGRLRGHGQTFPNNSPRR